MMIRFLTRLVLVSAVLCSSARLLAADSLVIQTTNYPLYYFASRLATDSFDVRFRVDPGVDPAFWEPGDEDLIAFQQADIIVLNGATYEKWLKTVTLPRSIMVDTSREFSDRFLEAEGEVHQHGDGSSHSHGGTAMTTWLDMELAALQAEAIAERMIESAPAEKESILERLKALKEDLAELDSRFEAVGQSLQENEVIVASHPVYQYLAAAYGMALESLEWEWDSQLGESELAELEVLISEFQPRWMLWESAPTKDNQAKMEARGLNNLVVSPCGNRLDGLDWLQVMHRNATALESMVR